MGVIKRRLASTVSSTRAVVAATPFARRSLQGINRRCLSWRSTSQLRPRRIAAIGAAAVTLSMSAGLVATFTPAATADASCVGATSVTTVDPDTGQPSTAATAATVRTINTPQFQGEFRIPPSSWQPLTATTQELEFYGLPARPTDVSALAAWTEEWSHYSGFTQVPELCPLGSATGLGTAPTTTISGGVQPMWVNGHTNSTNWSGILATRGNYYSAYGVTYAPTRGTYCNAATHVNWVGIGGWNTDTQLAQNGIYDRNATQTLDIWWELVSSTYDTGLTGVSTTFGIAPGDQYSMSTRYHWYDPTTTKVPYFTFYWHNYRTGEVTSFNVSGAGGYPADHFYSGRTAEAIDERTENLGTRNLYALEPFNPSKWDTAKDYLTDGSSYAMRSDTHTWLDMINDAATYPLAESEVLSGSNAEQFQDHFMNCGIVEPK